MEGPNPFDSLGNVVLGCPRDWSADPVDAWVFGIVCGWSRAALVGVAKRHKWDRAAVDRLCRLRHRFACLQREPLRSSTPDAMPRA